MYETAISILKKLEQLGYEAYIIGGYPRDLLLNIQNDDIDICTSATPDIIIDKFEVVADYSKFGSVRIKKNNFIFEITTFRIDTYDNDRYPTIEYTKTLQEDLKRRDFAINTLCIDSNKQIIDLMGAREDLANKLIRCVGDTETKLKEDPLRILRAIRFKTALNFNLNPELEDKIKQYSYLLNNLNKSQIDKEVSKMNKEGLKELDKLRM